MFCIFLFAHFFLSFYCIFISQTAYNVTILNDSSQVSCIALPTILRAHLFVNLICIRFDGCRCDGGKNLMLLYINRFPMLQYSRIFVLYIYPLNFNQNIDFFCFASSFARSFLFFLWCTDLYTSHTLFSAVIFHCIHNPMQIFECVSAAILNIFNKCDTYASSFYPSFSCFYCIICDTSGEQ